jgi:hypothetical protein
MMEEKLLAWLGFDDSDQHPLKVSFPFTLRACWSLPLPGITRYRLTAQVESTIRGKLFLPHGTFVLVSTDKPSAPHDQLGEAGAVLAVGRSGEVVARSSRPAPDGL